MEFERTGRMIRYWHFVRFLAGLFMIVLSVTACTEGDSTVQQDLPQPDVRNGEQIYFTSFNAAGERITYQGGPAFGGMMVGRYLTCATCHGPEGQGGTHIMHMQIMDAPAVSYRALNEEGEGHEGEAEEHTDEPGDYSLEDFRQAVVEGQHPDGESLDEAMPRWNLREEDLRDLFAFLQKLP